MDSRRSGSVDEEAKFRDKHQVLLQEYLVLQKDCVSKKRKLKEAKERKEALLGEIRFLRHRRSFLLKIQSQNAEQQLIAAQTQKTDAKYDVEPNGRPLNANEPTFRDPTFQNSQHIMGSMWNSGSVGKEVSFPPLRIGKKPKDLFTNSKRVEKRKISWQDQLFFSCQQHPSLRYPASSNNVKDHNTFCYILSCHAFVQNLQLDAKTRACFAVEHNTIQERTCITNVTEEAMYTPHSGKGLSDSFVTLSFSSAAESPSDEQFCLPMSFVFDPLFKSCGKCNQPLSSS